MKRVNISNLNVDDEANMYTNMCKELNIVVMNGAMDKEAAAEDLPSEEILLVAFGYVFDTNRAKGGGGSHDGG